jgi:hypothetical protein
MFPHQNLAHAPPLAHPSYMLHSSHSRFYHPHSSGWGVQNITDRDTWPRSLKRTRDLSNMKQVKSLETAVGGVVLSVCHVLTLDFFSDDN